MDHGPCQWNLIKTLQNEPITPLITKIALKLLDPKESTLGDVILGIKLF